MSLETFDAAVSLEVEGDQPAAAVQALIDDISEDEFERLLDELHGGGAPGRQTEHASASAKTCCASSLAVSAGDGDITDDEFEAILDQLHGKGSFIPGQSIAPARQPQHQLLRKVSAPAVSAASSHLMIFLTMSLNRY